MVQYNKIIMLSVNVFLALVTIVLVVARLSSGHSSSYIVQCRDCSNPAAINKFTQGSVIDLLSFIVFAILVLVTHIILSMRVYRIHRQLAIAVLSLGVLLLVTTIIVSNALLALR
jgi:hypothetical protein